MSDYTANDLVALLKKRYITNDNIGYNHNIVLEQVPNGTGQYQDRWIDAVVFSMFPSKGLTRFAFEIKISRSDFIQELNHPEKHQWCKECFHEFWFVAPKEVIQLEELPQSIGWMYPTATTLRIARHAKRNETPKLDDVLLAAFMRACGKTMDNIRRTSKEDILKQDFGYNNALKYQEAIKTFCQSRGVYPDIFHSSYNNDISIEQIMEHLKNATMDKQLKQDRDELLSFAFHFQSDLLNLLSTFLIITKQGLLIRDNAGKYIVDKFGGTDEGSLEELRKHATNIPSYANMVKIIETLNTSKGIVES